MKKLLSGKEYQMKIVSSKIIDPGNALLKPFLNGKDNPSFSKTLQAFIKQQVSSWPELKSALLDLDNQMIKDLMLADLPVRLHHNPRRIKSSAAKVDKAAIDKRPCFLCPGSLYEKQLGLSWHDHWLILNNPFPIFKDHLVISSKDHVLQNVHDALPAMVDFVEDSCFSFSAFYNGPACGASAPDHLHFQACRNHDLLIISQLEKMLADVNFPAPSITPPNASCRIHAVTLDNRGMLVCCSAEKDLVRSRLMQALSFLKKQTGSSEEPLVNILLFGARGRFTAVLFPRKAHRPECFFLEGSAKMLISPGTVDVCGSIILPRREDFDRMDRAKALKIYTEVCLDHWVFKNLSFSDMD